MSGTKFTVSIEKRNGLTGTEVARQWTAKLEDYDQNAVMVFSAASARGSLDGLKRDLLSAISAVDELLEIGK